ncbi:MAG: DUF4262 domain-containing protein [Streptosporangiaceae bacterium]|nr:DUF4262 domain-containing protein [Streptosporangiaceae bacterium]MBV9856772.1 DUF4262 domain-containing protein [Streptosporangiaceae bacterium]
MCWQCDHPTATPDDFLDYMRGLITQYGWAVQGVERDRIHPPWAYTVGLTPQGHPELVVTGMPIPNATSLLNNVAAHVLHAEAPRPGEQVQLRGGPLIEIVDVAVPDAHLYTAVDLYGRELHALQIVHADDRGNWPWDREYRGVRGGQPVLGVRVPKARRRRIG